MTVSDGHNPLAPDSEFAASADRFEYFSILETGIEDSYLGKAAINPAVVEPAEQVARHFTDYTEADFADPGFSASKDLFHKGTFRLGIEFGAQNPQGEWETITPTALLLGTNVLKACAKDIPEFVHQWSVLAFLMNHYKEQLSIYMQQSLDVSGSPDSRFGYLLASMDQAGFMSGFIER